MSPKNKQSTKSSMSDAEAAPMLAALGSQVRLELFRRLIRAGSEGLSVTGLQRSSGIPPSTLGHHIRALLATGLVSQAQFGRELICRAEYADIRRLSTFLLTECCADADCRTSQNQRVKKELATA